MVILKSIAWILATLLVLPLLLSLFPLDLLLQSDGENGFRIRVRFLGMIFGGSPKEKKKKQENAFTKVVKKSLGLAEENGDSEKKKDFATGLRETVDLFRLILDRVFWILKRCRVPYCRITAVSGGEDAALDYGIACATLYPLAGYLQERMNARPEKIKMDLRCDYERREGSFALDLAIRIRVVHLLRALIYILVKNIKKELNGVS